MRIDDFSTNDQYPGEVVDRRLLGDGKTLDDDRYEAHRYYHGRRLNEVTYDSLVQEYGPGWWAGHNFLLPEAFVFFLPALIDIAMKKYNSDRVDMMADSLVLNLWSMAFDEEQPQTKAALRQYTKEQLLFFSEFLVKMAERHQVNNEQDNATPALYRFWNRYLIN